MIENKLLNLDNIKLRNSQDKSISFKIKIKIKCGIMKRHLNVHSYAVTTIVNVIINHHSRLYFFY